MTAPEFEETSPFPPPESDVSDVQTDLFGMPLDNNVAATSSTTRRRAEVAAAPCLPVEHVPDLFLKAADALPPAVYLGTSSWSFSGWQGLLYRDAYSNTALARDGLHAYAASPLLHAVGIDRSFYAPLEREAYQTYADQVPAHFRFIVKAPSRVCDAALRGAGGMPSQANPDFLNTQIAIDDFVRPCLDGLGDRAGVLVFQLSPLTDAQLADPIALTARLGQFFAALPDPGPARYALEMRDASLLTPRLIKMLREQGVRYCIGIHARMPDAQRQAAALAMLDAESIGPLVVRWSLHAGMRYEGAKARYEPFDAIVDPDLDTRHTLAALIARYARAGQASFIIVNNKAEGSSPLSCAWLALAVGDAMRAIG